MMMRRQRFSPTGFSLVELMVTVAIIGILSGIAISITGNEWRRERVNTVAVEFVGWLEQVRSASLRQVDPSTNAGGCQVTLTTPLTNAAPGTVLATVSPAACSPEPSFTITGFAGTTTTFGVQSSNGTSIIFTPRGSVISTGGNDVVVRIFLDDSSLLRCVTVGAILGGISIASNQSASSAGDTCSAAASRF